jgi:hypothetical protein
MQETWQHELKYPVKALGAKNTVFAAKTADAISK